MAFILAVKAGEAVIRAGRIIEVARRVRGNMGTGSGAGFIGAVGAVAVVVVDAGGGNADAGIGDAFEVRGEVEEFGD